MSITFENSMVEYCTLPTVPMHGIFTIYPGLFYELNSALCTTIKTKKKQRSSVLDRCRRRSHQRQPDE